MKKIIPILIILPILLTNCGSSSNCIPEEGFVKMLNVDENNLIKESGGLCYQLEKEGTGQTAKNGDTVAVHYTGWLTDGTKFDSSYSRGKPLEFELGKGNVIKGWDQGIAGMKVGEKRKLIIPPSLGYGSEGVEVIPGNSVLVFDVELMEVK